MSSLPLLQAAPPLAQRAETVDAPELGGAVIVRGLTGSELFAIMALRQRAIERATAAADEYRQHVKALPEGQPAPEFEPPALDFTELRDYARWACELLAHAVRGANDLAIYTADQWDVAAQHYPALVARLRRVAERLSGMDAEDVAKN